MTDIIVKDIKNGSEYYYGGSAEVSAEDVSYDNSSSGATADNIQDAMDEVFQSVSNGKTLIAAAITDKGVPTAASDSFQTMAGNIESINTHDKANNVLRGSVGSLMGEVKYSGSPGAIASALFDVCGIKFAVAGTYNHSSDSGYNDRGLLAVYEDGRSYFFNAFKTVSTDYSYSMISTFYVDDPNKVYIIIGSYAPDTTTTTAAGYVQLINGVYQAFFPSGGEPIPTGTRTSVSRAHTGTYPMLNITNEPYFRHVLFINNNLS